MFGEYMPKTAILIWSMVLSCARFENQRWIRARMGGLQGSSAWFGLFIDATGLIALVFAVTIAALSLYDFGWRKTAGLLVVTLLGGWCWAAIGAFVAGVVGQLPLWLIGTVLVYVAAIMLFFQFSWFGFF
jgi:hypothetical protein